MTPGLRYQVTPVGVVLRLTADNGATLSVTVTEGHAKAKAWGLLADLDPEEVRTAAPPAYSSQEARLTPIRARVLKALARGNATAAELVDSSGVSSHFIAARMLDLRNLGWAARVDTGSGRGHRATYAITPAGTAALALNVRRAP